MPELSLGLHHKMELRMDHGYPSFSMVSILGLSQKQVLKLLEEIVTDAKEGRIGQAGAPENECYRGNYVNTDAFRKKVKNLSGGQQDETPAFAISNDLAVSKTTDGTRKAIETLLSDLKRTEPALIRQIFSKSILQTLDWAEEKRQLILEHLSGVQADYIFSPSDKLLLKHQTQEDVGLAVDISTSSVCRLVKPVLVAFPDESVHPAESLIPGLHIDKIKGVCALEKLQDDPGLYNPQTGWEKSSQILAREMRERYGLRVVPRTVRNYMKLIQDRRRAFRKSPRNSSRKPAED